MSTETKLAVMTDPSVFLNFLKIRRADLFVANTAYSFLVTEHGTREVTDQYPDDQAALEAAMAAGQLTLTVVDGIDELNLFAKLKASDRLGDGECAAIAAAVVRNIALATDDKRAAKAAREIKAEIEVLTTQSIVVSLIKQGVLSVEEADKYLLEWSSQHRFQLNIKGFGELL